MAANLEGMIPVGGDHCEITNLITGAELASFPGFVSDPSQVRRDLGPETRFNS